MFVACKKSTSGSPWTSFSRYYGLPATLEPACKHKNKKMLQNLIRDQSEFKLEGGGGGVEEKMGGPKIF